MFCIFPAISLTRAFPLKATRRDYVSSPFQMFFGLFKISWHDCPSKNSYQFNVQPSCFLFSSSSLLLTRATRQCAYASSGRDKKKITLYRNIFRNLNFKNILNFFKRTCYFKTRIEKHIKKDNKTHIYKHLRTLAICFESHNSHSFKIFDKANSKFDLKI